MMLAEPPIYVTRMTRCKACGTSFASADQVIGTQSFELDLRESHVEMCPVGHVGRYTSADYYFL
jgi:hypothetical protein